MSSKQDTLAFSISNQVPILGSGIQISQPGSPTEDDKDVFSPNEKLVEKTEHVEAQIPMKYRIMAFAFVVFFSTGAAFAEITLGPLKSTLKKELGLNSMSPFIVCWVSLIGRRPICNYQYG
jgi:hypothetical protein